VSNDGCGAPAGGVTITKDKASNQAIIEGQVLRGGAPVARGYARLLGSGDEFVAEVPLGDDGGFRFFAAPGEWVLRVLAPGDVRLEQEVTADIGQVTKVSVMNWPRRVPPGPVAFPDRAVHSPVFSWLPGYGPPSVGFAS